MVSLSKYPNCEVDIVTQLVDRVGGVIGNWLSGSGGKKRKKDEKKSSLNSNVGVSGKTKGNSSKLAESRQHITEENTSHHYQDSDALTNNTQLSGSEDKKRALQSQLPKTKKRNSKNFIIESSTKNEIKIKTDNTGASKEKKKNYFRSKHDKNNDRNKTKLENRNNKIDANSSNNCENLSIVGNILFVCSGKYGICCMCRTC